MDNGASSYRRFLDGDEHAIDEIMEELFFPLVFFINRYVQDVPAAEDLAMDAVSELFVHPRRYNFKTSLKTYLFTLGKSRALNYCKRRQIVPMEALSEEIPAEQEDLEQKVLRDERKRKVNAALAQLPADMRTAVHLVYFEDLSYEEAARVMKKSRKQVDNLLYLAKKELRRILGEEGRQLL